MIQSWYSPSKKQSKMFRMSGVAAYYKIWGHNGAITAITSGLKLISHLRENQTAVLCLIISYNKHSNVTLV